MLYKLFNRIFVKQFFSLFRNSKNKIHQKKNHIFTIQPEPYRKLKMDHSDGSHNDSTFDTSNLSFDAQFFEDHRSDSSSSLDEQNDPFDDDETERKFVPNNDELGVLGNKTAPTTAAILESTNTTTATTTTTTITPSTSAHNMGEHLTTNGETIFEQIANGATVKTLDTFVVPKENALRKRKSIFELFPWLNEVNRINQQCLGSMIELKNSKLLDVMDFLIGYSF